MGFIARIIVTAGTFLMLTEAAVASPQRMICENPRREYLVRFDAVAGSFTASAEEGTTRYRVRSVQAVSGGWIIKGSTPPPGPDFLAFTSGKRKIEYRIDGKLIQVDFCR